MLEANDDVDLLFTDISMPGELDGLDLVRLVRETRPEVAVVLTSGQAVAADGDLIDGAPFLSKPYTAHALMEAIRSLRADAREGLGG
jgi:CheY-like chemotaxis protein